LNAGLCQRTKAADEGNAPQEDGQTDQKAEKRAAGSPSEPKRSKCMMLSSFEAHCPDEPNSEEQEEPQTATDENACQESRKIAEAAKRRCSELSREQTEHDGHKNGSEVHSAAEEPSTPAAPCVPNEKEGACEEECRLPEWRPTHWI
jgi:hypothetical protein